jgi:hypothetical protein
MATVERGAIQTVARYGTSILRSSVKRRYPGLPPALGPDTMPKLGIPGGITVSILYALALASALGFLTVAVLVAFAALCDSIENHWTTVLLLCLALAALAAPFLVRDGFETVYLVVPFAFGLVMVPGLLATILVDAVWRALMSAKRKRPADRLAHGHGRAERHTWTTG